MSTFDPVDAFLRQEVESASPAKLHWMLLQRAHGLSIIVRDLWKKGETWASGQWVIQIREILTELLEGIVDKSHPLAKQQSDLYVFLSKLLTTAEQSSDVTAMDNMREILEIESTTWEMLVRRESGTITHDAQSFGENTESAPIDFSA